MAGGRRRGTNKTKAKGDMSLGDLVLAKVKGFPFWPAMVRLLISLIIFILIDFMLIRCGFSSLSFLLA